MGMKSTRSHGIIIAIPRDDFTDQKILSYEETCTFNDDDIEVLNLSETFPIGNVFKAFDARIQIDFISLPGLSSRVSFHTRAFLYFLRNRFWVVWDKDLIYPCYANNL